MDSGMHEEQYVCDTYVVATKHSDSDFGDDFQLLYYIGHVLGKSQPWSG